MTKAVVFPVRDSCACSIFVPQERGWHQLFLTTPLFQSLGALIDREACVNIPSFAYNKY